MASNRNTCQLTHKVSVDRNSIVSIACSSYNKKILMVFIILLSELEGYRPPSNYSLEYKDPLNFKKINKKQIANQLDISKDDVEKAIVTLYNDGWLEQGSNAVVKHGYRFTF